MKKIFITLTLLTTLFLLQSHACDCDYNGDFEKVSKKADLVASVKITKHLTYADIYDELVPMSMEVEIIEVRKGIEKRKSVIVWGDNGILCRPYLSKFKVGDTYMIAFFKGKNGKNGYVHKDERPEHYAISSCGEYWFSVDDKN